MSPEEVKEALTHKCDMCGAGCGEECHSIINGKLLRDEPRGLPVHFYRKDCK